MAVCGNSADPTVARVCSVFSHLFGAAVFSHLQFTLSSDRVNMHHGKHYRRFNRSSSHRQHMLRNLTTSLIRYGRIRTTLPKAKELRPLADKVSKHIETTHTGPAWYGVN
jgi:hypothetical protein